MDELFHSLSLLLSHAAGPLHVTIVERVQTGLYHHLLVEKCSSCTDSRPVYNEKEEGLGERRQFLSDESVESS